MVFVHHRKTAAVIAGGGERVEGRAQQALTQTPAAAGLSYIEMPELPHPVEFGRLTRGEADKACNFRASIEKQRSMRGPGLTQTVAPGAQATRLVKCGDGLGRRKGAVGLAPDRDMEPGDPRGVGQRGAAQPPGPAWRGERQNGISSSMSARPPPCWPPP